MEENKQFHNRYQLEHLLGRGAFSEVWLAKDKKTGIEVALKIYAPATGLDDKGLDLFAREFALVVNANHKNLLKPIYYDNCDRKPYLVLPYCKRGSLMRDVGSFSELQAWRLLRDVASGLAWLHAMTPPIIHQDIKPDNILVTDNGDFAITDFGVSTRVKSTLRKSVSASMSSAGTLAYMAPERFERDNTPIMANDIYSLGATTYEMLTGDTPFGNDGGLVQKKGAEVPMLQGKYSIQLKKVLYKCLQTKPWLRPTAEQLEKYAQTAIDGGTISFNDEKPLINRYKWPVLAASIVVVLTAAISVILNIRADERMRQEIIAAELTAQQVAIEHTNDSLSKVIRIAVSEAEEQIRIGDCHGEGFEKAYLTAWERLSSALKTASEFQGGCSFDGMDSLSFTLGLVENKLLEAREEINSKLSFYDANDKDDIEIINELTQRINSIDMQLGKKK